MNIFSKFQIKVIEACGNIGEALFLEPFLFERKKNLTIIKNLQYQDGKRSKRKTLDLYYLDDKKKKPVFLFIHGGGFVCGRKETKKYYCYHYARAGYFVVNINYEYGYNFPFPSNIQQALKAFEYIFDNQDEYDLDLDNVVLAGDSAGAYIASYIPVLNSFKGLYESLNLSFKYKDRLKIKALVLISGLYDLKETLRAKFPCYKLMYAAFSGNSPKDVKAALVSRERDVYSTLDKITGDYPQTVIITSKSDPLKACSFSLDKTLNQHDIQHQLYICNTGFSIFHSGGINVKRGDGKTALEGTLKFLDTVISK